MNFPNGRYRIIPSIEIAVAVTTAPRPVPTITDTIASLGRAGFDDIVVVAEPGSPKPKAMDSARIEWFQQRHQRGPWPNWLDALGMLLERSPDADAYLIFQDDIEAAHGLRGWLERELWPGYLGAKEIGVVSLYTVAEHDRAKDGWFRLLRSQLPQKALGALGSILPAHAARTLLANPPNPNWSTGIDYCLGNLCSREGLSYWLHSPSLLRHTGATSSIGGHDQGNDEGRQCKRWAKDVNEI